VSGEEPFQSLVKEADEKASSPEKFVREKVKRGRLHRELELPGLRGT